MTHIPIPERLHSKKVLFDTYFSSMNHALLPAVQNLLCVSDYAERMCHHLQTLLCEDDCLKPLRYEDYQHQLSMISCDDPLPSYMKALRHFRHRHLLRLLLREIAALSSTEETMAAWSDCADVMILQAVHYCQQQLLERYGNPITEASDTANLSVIAMGKLGGQELNVSSDIDLIFAFSGAGQTNGKESVTNQHYFDKLVQMFVQLLQTVTKDGFVFRVDLRLRPNGDSGPLVSSVNAMYAYYQEQGRDWERYAMVKARLIGHSSEENQWFYQLITPFVYRRYVDFSVIESLRSMKAMIEREIQLNPMLDDIKRGQGGIREIEFIIQCFQLTRGGRNPHLQQRNAILALRALKEERVLGHTAVLVEAYLFLRKLENALQMQNDQQTHALPDDSRRQIQLVMAMGASGWDALLNKLHQYQRIVSYVFHAVLHSADSQQDEKRLLENQLVSLWQGHLESSMAITLLQSLNYQNAEQCYQMIYAFRHSPRCRRLSQVARLRLDKFMVHTLMALSDRTNTDGILLNVLSLLEAVIGRSAYLALLTENPPALEELLYWFAESPFITNLLVHQPFLLEVLVDQKQTWRPSSRRQLAEALKTRLTDRFLHEAEEDLLRQFKLNCWLQAARAEVYGHYDAVRIGQFLADVAEVIVSEVLLRSCHQLSERYPSIMRFKSQFAIIAYGKLGSREMNYDSDIDLVFLHTVPPEEEGLVTRLTQKILHMLTTRSQVGVLYSVDTRLRPSGSAGLLVSHVDAFMAYQRTNAWTWEHQALLRARVLFANTKIRKAFVRLKKDVLAMPREPASLWNEVQAMRAKIGVHTGIKHIAGGLLDLEFFVQFLVLAHPEQGFERATNTLSQLKQLRQKSILSPQQFIQLRAAYLHYHRVLHQGLLQSQLVDSKGLEVGVLATIGSHTRSAPLT